MRHKRILTVLLALLGVVAACRDQDEPPRLTCRQSLDHAGKPLMPTVLVRYDATILDGAGTQLPEIEEAPEDKVERTPVSPEQTYLTFKKYLATLQKDPEVVLQIPTLLDRPDSRALTLKLLGELFKLPKLISAIGKRAGQKFPEAWTRLQQKMAKVAIGTSIKYSKGDPSGILFTVGSPVGSPNRYFVPLHQESLGSVMVFKFGDIETRGLKIVDEVLALSDELEGDKLTADEFERRATDLMVAFLKLPFENNPELSNVQGRKSSPDPVFAGATESAPPAAPEQAEEKPRPTRRRPVADAETQEPSATPGPTARPAGGSSVLKTLFGAAKAAYSKAQDKSAGATQTDDTEPSAEADDAPDDSKQKP